MGLEFCSINLVLGISKQYFRILWVGFREKLGVILQNQKRASTTRAIRSKRLKSPGHSATEQQQKEVQTNEGKHLLVQIVTEAE